MLALLMCLCASNDVKRRDGRDSAGSGLGPLIEYFRSLRPGLNGDLDFGKGDEDALYIALEHALRSVR